jgi:hypothetical protein
MQTSGNIARKLTIHTHLTKALSLFLFPRTFFVLLHNARIHTLALISDKEYAHFAKNFIASM